MHLATMHNCASSINLNLTSSSSTNKAIVGHTQPWRVGMWTYSLLQGVGAPFLNLHTFPLDLFHDIDVCYTYTIYHSRMINCLDENQRKQ